MLRIHTSNSALVSPELLIGSKYWRIMLTNSGVWFKTQSLKAHCFA